MSENLEPINISSRPTDGLEGEMNKVRLFRLCFQRLKYMYQTHIGLSYGDKEECDKN